MYNSSNLTSPQTADDGRSSEVGAPAAGVPFTMLGASDQLLVLKSRWVSPQRMRKKQKDLFKLIRSLEQGQNGKIAICEHPECGKLGEIEHLQVHHVDHIESHNQISNLQIMHQNCNNTENSSWRIKMMRAGDPTFMQRSVCVSEQGSQARVNERTAILDALQWSSKEGVKHETQRHAWNKWVVDREVGPFKGVNTNLYPVALAEMAPWGIGRYIGLDGPLGSSVTYRRFVNEDVRGGILLKDEDSIGKMIVYLNIQKLAEKDPSNPK